MASVSFPFCICTTRHADLSCPVVHPDAAGYVAAFSTVEKATAYMVAKRRTNWQLKLVSRAAFKELVEALNLLGVKGICLDPGDNVGGGIISFDEIDQMLGGSQH